MKKFNSLITTLFFISPMFLGSANAITYSFDDITNNDPGDVAIGEAQLFLDVNDIGSGQVEFVFRNTGPDASSITDIYFDDDVPLMYFSSFDYITSGVLYTVGATPGVLPGGNDPLYTFSSDYDYDSAAPVQPNGVNPGESLGLIFNLGASYLYQDIISALDSSNMRVGIHVQGFASGGSESFINTPSDPNVPVPEPATMLLFGTGLAGLAGIARRKRN